MNIGDKVRVINSVSPCFGESGTVRSIRSTTDIEVTLYIGNWLFLPSELELVSAIPTFAVGDLVCIIKNSHPHLSKIGRIHNINGISLTIDTGNKLYVGCQDDEIALLQKAPTPPLYGHPNFLQPNAGVAAAPVPFTAANIGPIITGWTEPLKDEDIISFNVEGLTAHRGESKIVSVCAHEMKDYFGLNERYRYCTKCNKKEGHI